VIVEERSGSRLEARTAAKERFSSSVLVEASWMSCVETASGASVLRAS
jgi:hypothetical protein